MIIKLIEPLLISEEVLLEYKEILLKQGHEFIFYNEKAKSEKEFIERAKDADILIIANTPLPDLVIEKCENLKLINVAFTGFDHVNVKLAKEKGIKVCNASGYSNTAVSELVIGLTLNIFRKIKEGDKFTRESKTYVDYYSGSEIKGKTVGIIGMGNIGIETAKLFKAFGANIIASSRSKRKEALDLGVKYMNIEDLMKKSDIVSIHLALNEKTKGYISKDLLKLMKKEAIFINCARGLIVDNKALAEILNEEKIAYAAIDVFDMEPPINKEYELLNSKNILLSPHIAYLTNESMLRRAHIAFDNTISFINGIDKNIVNK